MSKQEGMIMQTQATDKAVTQQAFTLIELLVVMGIILLLAALVIPVSRNAIESARRAKCQTNLRQIAAAVLYYANDHKGRTPDLEWNTQYLQHELLGPYISPQSDIYQCPSATPENRGSTWPENNCVDIGDGTFCTDYKLNDDSAYAGQNSMAFLDHSWVVVAMDLEWGPPRHGDGHNLAFLAGHVIWLSREDQEGEDPYGNSPWYRWGLEQPD